MIAAVELKLENDKKAAKGAKRKSKRKRWKLRGTYGIIASKTGGKSWVCSVLFMGKVI